jgi:hypothetical protein
MTYGRLWVQWLGGAGRPHSPVAPDACFSLVVSTLQEDRFNESVSSCQVHLRREHAGRHFLQKLRQLEYLADSESALCCLFVEGHQTGVRVPLPKCFMEDAQSESSASYF